METVAELHTRRMVDTFLAVGSCALAYPADRAVVTERRLATPTGACDSFQRWEESNGSLLRLPLGRFALFRPC